MTARSHAETVRAGLLYVRESTKRHGTGPATRSLPRAQRREAVVPPARQTSRPRRGTPHAAGLRCLSVAASDATPEQPSYPLDGEALALIRIAGIDFIDLRHTEGLSSDIYRDEIHLTPGGRVIFTRGLADRLAVLLGRHQ